MLIDIKYKEDQMITLHDYRMAPCDRIEDHRRKVLQRKNQIKIGQKESAIIK